MVENTPRINMLTQTRHLNGSEPLCTTWKRAGTVTRLGELMQVEIDNEELELEQTCGACPEQYDVYDSKGNEIGYMRLRHGNFYAEYMGQIVYRATPRGDGIFESEERNYYLNKAVMAIKEARADASNQRERPVDWRLRNPEDYSGY